MSDATVTIGDIVDNRYVVQAELGRGAMGLVFRALDIGLARQVALKIVAPELCGSEAMTSLLRAEARALARVHSPHVADVYAFGDRGGSVFFAMELVVGTNLGDVLTEHAARGALLPMHRAFVLLRQVASGLDAVHAAGLVHRDVKPDNVVVEDGTGRPVLVDFGLAVRRVGPGSEDVPFGGTPGYMAPEQIAGGHALDARADVYALACTAYEVLCGRLPFDGASVADLLREHMVGSPTPVSTHRPDIGGADAVFARALAKDPAQRHPTCAELIDALERACAQVPRPTVPVPPPDDRIVVLVVDDDPTFARLSARAAGIAFHGIPSLVQVAHDGHAALAHARAHPPHLILLDYDMPGLDGIHTLSLLRELPGCERSRAMVISGTAAQQEKWRFSALGVVDFLGKPVGFPQLLEALEGVAQRSGIRLATAPDRARKGPP